MRTSTLLRALSGLILILLLQTTLPTVIYSQATKKIVVEDLTASWCGLCPEGLVTMERVQNNFANIIPVSMHISDPMALPENEELSDVYSGGGVNLFLLDRYKFNDLQFVQFSFEYDLIAEKIQERLQMTAPVDVSVENLHFNPQNRQLTVTVRADFYSSINNKNLRFNLWVVEDNVQKVGNNGYHQANFFVGYQNHVYANAGNPIKDFVHRHVLRAIVGETWGTDNSLPASISKNSSHTYTYNFTLDEEWDMSEIYLIPLVQAWDEDYHFREIVNADEIRLQTALDFATSTEEKTLTTPLKVYPNPALNGTAVRIEFALAQTAETKVSVLDIFGKTLTLLSNERTAAGMQTLHWNGCDQQGNTVPKGVYLIRIQTEDGRENIQKVSVF